VSAAKKVVHMYDGQEDDRVLMLTKLRAEIKNGKGIALTTACKLLWEMMGKPKEAPQRDPDDDEPITFLIAGPLDENEISSNERTVGDNPAPGAD